MKDSYVGDPIHWPALTYAPLNKTGLIFATGIVASRVGLLFEEFSEDAKLAYCRRKTPKGWQRLKVAFETYSSNYDESDQTT